MKHAKKLTRNMKGFLNKLGLDCNIYRLERRDNVSYTFLNLETNKLEKYYFVEGE